MARCGWCDSLLLFGGERHEGKVYCDQKCLEGGVLLAIGSKVPPEVLKDTLRQVHAGDCPNCGKRGPVDVHTSYRVWSALVLTRWSSRVVIGCRGCGNKARLADFFFTFFLGWWGIPWGLLITPIQLSRNLYGLLFSGPSLRPSPALERVVRVRLGAYVIEQSKVEDAEE
jgi:hypothetical protein